MVSLDTCVDDVGTSSGARAVVICVSGGARTLAGQASKAPIGILLRGLDCDNGVLFNVLNLLGCQFCCLFRL